MSAEKQVELLADYVMELGTAILEIVNDLDRRVAALEARKEQPVFLKQRIGSPSEWVHEDGSPATDPLNKG